MTLKAILFDLDGTLIDTAPDFTTIVNQLRVEEKLEPLPTDQIRRVVSNGARALVNMAFGLAFDHPDFERLHRRLLELYGQHLAVDTRPFPGIPQLLTFLAERNIPWGIVTNKSSIYTLPILEALNFDPAPQSVVCPDHVSNTKPDPEPLLLACKQIGCTPEEALYIGDHKRDVDCGKNAGSPTVAVTFGYIAESENPADWNADYLVDHASEIQSIVEQLL